MLKSGNLVIFVGLACEGRAIIDWFSLKQDMSVSAYKIYRKNNIYLVVTGVGLLNMGAAVSFVAGLGILNVNSVALNIGVAGGKNFQFGELLEVNKVSRGKSNFYPVKLAGFNLNEAGLVTSIEAAKDYKEGEIYDMEGHGFFEIALKFISLEQILVFKIISDRSEEEHELVSKEVVDSYFEKNKEKLNEIFEFYLGQIKKLEAVNNYPEEFYELIKDKKLTFSQKAKLKKEIIFKKNRGENVF